MKSDISIMWFYWMCVILNYVEVYFTDINSGKSREKSMLASLYWNKRKNRYKFIYHNIQHPILLLCRTRALVIHSTIYSQLGWCIRCVFSYTCQSSTLYSRKILCSIFSSMHLFSPVFDLFCASVRPKIIDIVYNFRFGKTCNRSQKNRNNLKMK